MPCLNITGGAGAECGYRNNLFDIVSVIHRLLVSYAIIGGDNSITVRRRHIQDMLLIKILSSMMVIFDN